MAVTALYQKTSPTEGVLMLFQFLLSTSTIAATANIFIHIYVSGTVLNTWPMGACVSLTARLCLTHWLNCSKSIRAGLQVSDPQRPCRSPGHIQSSFSVCCLQLTPSLTHALQISMLQKLLSTSSGYFFSTCDHPILAPCAKNQEG